MAVFSDLPNEVLVLIGETSSCEAQYHLTMTNHHLHDLVNPILYKHNIQHESGSAVFWAACYGRLDTLEYLRKYGAEWNDSSASRLDSVYDLAFPDDKDGTDEPDAHDTYFTPLHTAAKFGQCSAVKWLLDRGARLEVASQNLCSCQEGMFGDSRDRRDSPLFTPLHIAVCHGHVATAELLLKRGAVTSGCLNTRSHQEDTTVLHTAARKNDGDMIKLIQRRVRPHWKAPHTGWVDVDTIDGDGYTAMHLSVIHHGELRALDALDPSAGFYSTPNGETPTSIAFHYGYFGACSKLKKYVAIPDLGPDFSAQGISDSFCHRAVLPMEHYFPSESPPDPDAWESERAAFLCQILKIPVFGGVDMADNSGRTPLCFATSFATVSARLIECLLDNGADANHIDHSQFTPLRRVCDLGDLNHFKVCAGPLLRHGARIDLQCGPHHSALEIAILRARVSSDFSTVQFLLQHATKANLRQEFLDWTLVSGHTAGFYAECRLLMQHGGRLVIPNKQLFQLLYESIKHESISQMLFYLDKFPDQVASWNILNMALSVSQNHGHLEQNEVVRLLFARPDLKIGPQPQGKPTLLHQACSRLAPLHFIEQLLNKGCEVNAFDDQMRTPLGIAIEEGCTHIALLLVKHGADPHARPPKELWADCHTDVAHPQRRLKIFASLHRLEVEMEEYRTPFEAALKLAVALATEAPLKSPCHKTNNCPAAYSAPDAILRSMLELHEPPPLPAEKGELSYIHDALAAPIVLQTLLKKGGDPNSGRNCTKPPLMHLLSCDDEPPLFGSRNESFAIHIELIAILLKHGADVHQKNEDGTCFTDVMRAACRAYASHPAKDLEFADDCCPLFLLQCWLLRNFRLRNGGSVEVIADGEICASTVLRDHERRRDNFLLRRARLAAEAEAEAEALRKSAVALATAWQATAERKAQQEREREAQKEREKRRGRRATLAPARLQGPIRRAERAPRRQRERGEQVPIRRSERLREMAEKKE